MLAFGLGGSAGSTPPVSGRPTAQLERRWPAGSRRTRLSNSRSVRDFLPRLAASPIAPGPGPVGPFGQVQPELSLRHPLWQDRIQRQGSSAWVKSEGCGLALAAVRDLREHRVPTNGEELPDFETDVLSGFVLARASAGLADSTIRNDTNHLELIRDWFGRPLWEMQPADADAYFGKVLRDAKPSTRTGRAAALTVFFQFLELRHKVELHNLTGMVVECPLDEMNRPRASVDPQLRIPPAEDEIEQLFAGWREEHPALWPVVNRVRTAADGLDGGDPLVAMAEVKETEGDPPAASLTFR